MAATGEELVKLSQLKTFSDTLGGGFNIDLVYPVGSVYLSMANVDPATLFGGTWSKLEGRFLLTSDSNNAAGNTGGSNDAVVVEHAHDASSSGAGDHTHVVTVASAGSHGHSAGCSTEGEHTHTMPSNDGLHGHSTVTVQSAGSHSHTCGNPNSQFVRSSSSSKPSCLDTTSTASPYFYTELWTNTSTSGSHTHTASANTTGSAHTHRINEVEGHQHSISVNSAGAHTHSAGTEETGGHTHPIAVYKTGSDGTGLNMPAYLVVNAWQRTA